MPRTTLPTLLFLLRAALATPFSKILNTNDPVEGPPAEPGSTEFWSKMLISTGLVLAGGVFAG